MSRDGGWSREPPGSVSAWRRVFPSVNVYDGGSVFLVTAELPGVTADDFELALTGGTLTLRGMRRLELAVPDEAYRRQERPFGAWSRSVSLPSKVDGERIRASLTHGVLTVELPKVEDLPTRQIRVEMGPE